MTGTPNQVDSANPVKLKTAEAFDRVDNIHFLILRWQLRGMT